MGSPGEGHKPLVSITVETQVPEKPPGSWCTDLVREHVGAPGGDRHNNVAAVEVANDSGVVEVLAGVLAAGQAATATFNVTPSHPFPPDVDSISSLGTFLSDQLPALLSDDPDASVLYSQGHGYADIGHGRGIGARAEDIGHGHGRIRT